MSIEQLKTALAPILQTLSALSPDDNAKGVLDDKHPIASLGELRALFREGVESGWLCDKGEDPVRFSRVQKAAGDDALGIDAVSMTAPGPGHTHPRGEFDLCFAVDDGATFDENPEGWTVYPAGSWHVPSVSGGRMDILYFLPGGAIRFEPKPS